MKYVTRLLREPLLHFFAIGGLIFLLYTMKAGPNPEPADTIVVESDRIEQLANGFQSVWRRPPSDDELRTMIDEFIREEIYYREALALGLDRNDTVIRQRLRQKMEFLTDTGADLLSPSAGELEAYLAANEKIFRIGPRLALMQIYFGETPDPERIAGSLSILHSDPEADFSTLGERTLLPAQLGLSSPKTVDGIFGQDFFEQLTKLPAGEWVGPVRSTYGVHIVRVLGIEPARMPPLDEVYEAVLWDWKAAKALEVRELHYARLRERFTVEIRAVQAKTGEGR